MITICRSLAALCFLAAPPVVPSAIATPITAVVSPTTIVPTPPIVVLPPPEPIEFSTTTLQKELLQHDHAVRRAYEKLKRALMSVYSNRRFGECSKKSLRGAICAEANKAMSDALLSWVEVKNTAEEREYFLDRISAGTSRDAVKAKELLQFVTPEPPVDGLLALLAIRKER